MGGDFGVVLQAGLGWWVATSEEAKTSRSLALTRCLSVHSRHSSKNAKRESVATGLSSNTVLVFLVTSVFVVPMTAMDPSGVSSLLCSLPIVLIQCSCVWPALAVVAFSHKIDGQGGEGGQKEREKLLVMPVL